LGCEASITQFVANASCWFVRVSVPLIGVLLDNEGCHLAERSQ